MRIGIITGEFPPMQGGVGDFTQELSNELAALGHETHILTRTGCRSAELHPAYRVHPEIERWNWSLFARANRWIKANRLEIVNLQYQAAAYGMHPAVNLLPRCLASVPLVVTFHDLNVPYLFPKAGRVRWWAVLTLAQHASGVIVTNQEDLAKLEGHGLRSRPTVIPIGSNISPAPPAGYDRSSWRESWGVQPQETLLSYFGFLNESKGGEDLVQALHLLGLAARAEARVREIRPPVRLAMIGGRTGSSDPRNRAYAEQVDALIARLCLQEQVLRTGYIAAEQVSASLLATDICVLPYRDGVSFRRGSFVAALAHGLPIITTTPAIHLPELSHGDNVYLVPPAEPGALAEAVTVLRDNPALRQRIAAGASRLAHHFRWDSIAQATADLFANTTA
jgi:glycosyltransferase involved in cell wall biosynthesis